MSRVTNENIRETIDTIMKSPEDDVVTTRDELLDVLNELLEARTVIAHYAGNFNGKDGSKWNKDTFFYEDKFGGSSTAFGGKFAQEHRHKWGQQ